jgi:GxxExxY protein
MSLPHEALTHAIIGAAIAVHRRLGPGFLESIYANALCVEIRRRSLPFDRETTISVMYEGVEVGQHRLDLVIGGLIVVELKAIKRLDDVHFAVVRSYLRAMGMEHGLLINFAAPTLQVRRVIATAGPQPHPPGFLASLEIPSGSE